MTDQVPSGDSAATNETPDAQPDAGSFGTFGVKRGSGLARGKRSSTPAASAAPAAPSGAYQPTALELITPQREYQNPFGGENTVAAPAAAESPIPPIESPAPEAPVAPVAAAAPEPATAQRAYVSEQTADAAAAPETAAEEEPAPKAELNILPPAETKRAATSWESREDRPVFRTDAQRAREGEPRRERRDHGRGGPDSPRSSNGPRPDAQRSPEAPRPSEANRPEGGPRTEGYRPDGQRSDGHRSDGHRSDGRRRFEESRGEARRPSESSSRHAEPSRPKGFFAWLKGLFGGKAAEPIPARPSERPTGEFRGGGSGGEHDRGPDGQRRRRHRGGRGRHGENRGEFRPDDRGGPRAEGSAESGGENQGSSQGGLPGEHRGGGEGHGGRRRHRGGRGRSRGEGGGGDRGGGGPRPEGQQGGGYI